jgi:hypothetical protein
MKTQVKKQSAAQWHAERISPSLGDTFRALEEHKRQLTKDLSGVTIAHKRLAKLVIKANKAMAAAETLAYTVNRNLEAGI